MSTNLFDDLYFRIGMTVLVVLQLFFVEAYALRFRGTHPVEAYLASVAALTALVGWTIVVSCNPSTDLNDHSIGAGLYVGGTAGYFVALLRLASVVDPASAHIRDCAAGLVLATAGGLGATYIALYFTAPNNAWLFENLALLGVCAGYVLFFFWHDFPPWGPDGPDRVPLIHPTFV